MGASQALSTGMETAFKNKMKQHPEGFVYIFCPVCKRKQSFEALKHDCECSHFVPV